MLRYSLALLFVGVALYWSLLCIDLFQVFPVIFLVAVMAVHGLPELARVICSTYLITGRRLLFFRSVQQFRLNLETLPYFLLFLMSSLATNWLSVVRKSAQEKQQAHLDELFEQAPEAIVLLDLQDRVVRINREFSRIFGYRPMKHGADLRCH